MAYDRELDKCLFSKSEEKESERLIVGIYSYNEGKKKLQISRENKDNQGNFKFAKLGRLTKEEVDLLLPLIQEAAKQMD
ncbi:MAG: hypothetical protein D8M57_16525 [Candidatus Scalindua sp. AMX11]|nr:MAG: hypothetical protein DWQ00_02660 [Candidatus Scalindua sp.]NOG83959.1 hypothetical protein [Planctomycetota bacterium]RZV88030.1 MAG: hypothetical protein EX341_06885 [Candidatus Scalindua sp. SCAELEC01]TDE63802.1 MAG: hypothetical protein D8M57_16525 [Candidatus Scalindua sp. AMX11]GJQ58392.1 MAG: hypothetical protein SCALA701_11930 [Candidatus Scalindua sp.]